MRRGIPRQGRPDPILTNRAPGGSQSRNFYTQAREIEAGADGRFVRFSPRSGNDYRSGLLRKPGNSETIGYPTEIAGLLHGTALGTQHD